MQTQQLYFTIGSVDSFERHLESLQQSLNIPPEAMVPVIYQNEGTIV